MADSDRAGSENMKITAEDLRRWQKEMDMTYESAALALGVSRRTYANWVACSRPIPEAIDLACAALLDQIEPYSARNSENIGKSPT